MKTRSDIQGLRALAVALVVLSHANLLHLTGGYVGVDVFFVISGYLITSIIIREYAANAARSNGLGWFSLRVFYLRRFKRIVPAALLVLVTTTVASYLLFNSVKAHGIAVDAIWSAFFLANLHFINQATDYFQQGLSTSLLQHFWSLAVEEQFYLIFPTLLLGALSLHGIKIRNIALNWRRRIGILVGLISIASFIWAVIATNFNPASSYFSSFSRAWELGLGASLAIFAQSSKVILPTRFRNLISVAGFLAILISSFLFTSSTPFPGFYTLIPTVGAALIIGSGINAETEDETIIQKVSNFSPVSYLGNISYSVYLWHLPILILAGQRYVTDSSKLWFKLILVASILLISTITYRIYENPLRQKIKVPANWYQNKLRARQRNQDSDQSLLRLNMDFIAIGAVAIVALTLVLLPSHKGNDSYKGVASQVVTPKPRSKQSGAEQSTISGTYTNLLTNWQQKISVGLNLTKVPANLDPSWSKISVHSQYNDHCDASSNKVACSYGKPDAIHKVVVMGDSYAAAIIPMVIAALDMTQWQVVALSTHQCMIADVVPLIGTGQLKPNSGCQLYRHWAFDYIAKSRPDLIVLADNATNSIEGPDGHLISNPGDNGSSFWVKQLTYSLAKISFATKNFIYFGTVPTSASAVNCVDAQLNLSASCLGRPSTNGTARAYEQQLTSQAGGVFLDPEPWLCYQFACPAIIDNSPVRPDGGHLGVTFVAKLGPLFNAFLKDHKLI